MFIIHSGIKNGQEINSGSTFICWHTAVKDVSEDVSGEKGLVIL
jgi:hypothetical protein